MTAVAMAARAKAQPATTWTTLPRTAALTAHLDLKNAMHVSHSTGGEVVHYIARGGESRVAKAPILSAVPPLMVRTTANPSGLPKEAFDGLQAQFAVNRSHSILIWRAVRSTATIGPARSPSKPLS